MSTTSTGQTAQKPNSPKLPRESYRYSVPDDGQIISKKETMTKTQITKLAHIQRQLNLDVHTAYELALVERKLQRWAERECGDSNNYNSFHVEVDDDGKAWSVITPHTTGAKTRRYRIPNQEAVALRKLNAICERESLNFYHQSDPRGCMVYVSREPLDSQNYTNGVATYI